MIGVGAERALRTTHGYGMTSENPPTLHFQRKNPPLYGVWLVLVGDDLGEVARDDVTNPLRRITCGRACDVHPVFPVHHRTAGWTSGHRPRGHVERRRGRTTNGSRSVVVGRIPKNAVEVSHTQFRSAAWTGARRHRPRGHASGCGGSRHRASGHARSRGGVHGCV